MVFRVVVVGATGIVGRSILNLLADRNFPSSNVIALSSTKSKGSHVNFGEDQVLLVDSLEEFSFDGIDFVLSSVEAELTRSFAFKALSKGAIIIDNSSIFRCEKRIPLIIPEINIYNLQQKVKLGIISSPNCIVIPLVLSLLPLKNLGIISRVNISTYQSVSGSGRFSMTELLSQSNHICHTNTKIKNIKANNFSRQIAFNVIPSIGNVDENGITDEENKIIYETQCLLDLNIEISVTAVRVPVFVGHGASVNVLFKEDINLIKATEIFSSSPGLTFIKNNENFITPFECVGKHSTFISRLRLDIGTKKGINFWMTCDNLSKGSALNVIQILEYVYSYLRV